MSAKRIIKFILCAGVTRSMSIIMHSILNAHINSWAHRECEKRVKKAKRAHTTLHLLCSFINFVECLCRRSGSQKTQKNTIQLCEYLHGNSINQVIYVLQFVLLLLLQLRKNYETNNMKFIVAVIRHWVTVRVPDSSSTCWREQKIVLCTKHTNQTLCVKTDATIFLKCSHATLFN